MLERSLGRWISLLYRYGQMFVGKELEPYDIGKGQFYFLLALYKRDGMRQEELADLLKIDKGTTARAIDKLEQAGYIRREPSQEDLRANWVFLTPKALDFKPELVAILLRWTEIISNGMAQEEIEQSFSLLERMAQNAIAYMKKQRDT